MKNRGEKKKRNESKIRRPEIEMNVPGFPVKCAPKRGIMNKNFETVKWRKKRKQKGEKSTL